MDLSTIIMLGVLFSTILLGLFIINNCIKKDNILKIDNEKAHQ